MSITNLRCEHVVNPMGVESAAPRLSWWMESDRRGARQTAYRIEVGSGPETGDLWDSGRVESDASVLVPYAGKRLRSRQRCWWQVRVWDETGEEHLSETAYWEMGLLREKDWKAKWIAGTKPRTWKHESSPSPLFRKAFRLGKPVAAARAYVCGLGFHELYLNGRRVGDAVLHPAFTRYDKRALYTVHDVTGLLSKDGNAVGLTVGTGWYDHHATDNWLFYAAPWRDECKVLVQIEVTFEDGTGRKISSDDSWLCTAGPIVFDGLRGGEVYDAREDKPGWNEPDGDETGWSRVRVARPPGGVLRAQLMPPCRVRETLRPASVKEIAPGVWIYDMGRNIAGWARLTVRGPAGTAVEMQYSEKLGKDGDVDRKNINSLFHGDVFQTDRYILKGEGVEIYECRFAYHGFRYVRVTGLPGEAAADMIVGRVVNTDLEGIGSFECSNEVVNAIQRASLASTVGNYHGMPTDCPHREKNGWTGDAHLSAEQVLYNFDAASAYTKWMDDFADCQRESGALPGYVPNGAKGFNWGAGPAWDSAYILIPWYLYVYRGDVDILRRHYDGMKRCLDFLGSIATDHIVHFGLGDWCPPEDSRGGHRAPAELTNTACYYADAVIMSRAAEILGKKADASRLEKLAEKIRKAARARFYDEKKKLLAGHGQTSLGCFLYQGLCEPDEIEDFTEMLVEEIVACDYHVDFGILGAKYVMNALTERDRADAAYRMVDRTDFPGWGHWIERGATTLWENWNGAASRNHHMFSDVSAWFYKTLAGIRPDPDRPGFKRTVIKPCPVGDLTFARGETRTPYGTLKSEWRREDGRLVLDVSIPPNSSAAVHVPSADGWDVHEIGSGDYRFESRM